jgi:hypothetical protein
MRRVLAALLIATFAVGCGPATTPTPVVPPSSTVAVTPTSSVAPSASASVSPSASAEALTNGDVEPGTYTRSGFEPPITFEVDDGWTVGTLTTGFFDIQQQVGTPDVIAVQFGRVDAVVGDGGALIEAPDAQEAVDAIKANPGLEVVGESGSLLGGKAGVVIEVQNTSGSHTQILQVPPGRLGIDSGRRLWIALFDTSDGLLAVMVGGSIDDWDHALEVAEPVLESIVIGE